MIKSQQISLLVIAGGIIILLLIIWLNPLSESEVKNNHLAALQVTSHEFQLEQKKKKKTVTESLVDTEKPEVIRLQPEITYLESTESQKHLEPIQLAAKKSEPTQIVPENPAPIQQVPENSESIQLVVEKSEPTQIVPENPAPIQLVPEKHPELAQTVPENFINKPAENKKGEFVFFPENDAQSGTKHEHLLKMENLLRERGWQVKNVGDAGLILIPGGQP